MPALSPASRMRLLPLLQRERLRRPVDHDRHLAGRVPGLRRLPGLVLVPRDAGRESLDPDLRVRAAARAQRVRDGLHHAVGTADEHRVDAVEIHPVREQRVRLRAVDPAVEELDVLRLARQHVDQVEPGEEAVLERGELLLEHHGAGSAVAVEQRELARRLGHERGLDEREQRRDPAAGGEADVVRAMIGRERHVEVPERRHHVEPVADPQRFVRPLREHAARVALDRDPQNAVLRARADRVGAPHVLAADVGAQRQVLAGGEAECVDERRRHGERDRHRVARLALDLRHREAMELAHDQLPDETMVNAT